ncbi:WD40/YVTN/BNR-like repeat-containing protein [Tunturiibacter lichenicola]|uniref:WD40/YVTN/BNR-like repeat-containing protein n=1 Tax=Tunturiibacter lichenicola TaxID=2051959 RepID=UPI003D9AD5EE
MPRPILLSAFVLATTSLANAQWEIQSAPTTASLRGIHALGNGIAWSSGSSGTVLRTTDDGAHWQLCATPPDAEKLDFRGIQAFDENTAIVMSSGKGDLSRLYKTIDGCQTWKLLFTNPDKEGIWDAIQFDQRNRFRPTSKYPNHGILVGDPVRGVFVIYESYDSGANWHRWEESGGTPPSNMGHRSAKATNGESLFAASNSTLAVPGMNGPFLFVTGAREDRTFSFLSLIARLTMEPPGSSLQSACLSSRVTAQEAFPSRRVIPMVNSPPI